MKKLNSSWFRSIYSWLIVLFFLWFFLQYSEKGYLDYDIDKLEDEINSYQPYLGIAFILIFLLLLGAFKSLKKLKEKIYSIENILLCLLFYFLTPNYSSDFIKGVNKIYKTKEIERKVDAKYIDGIFCGSYFENDSIQKTDKKDIINLYNITRNYEGEGGIRFKREGVLVSDVGLFGIPFNPRWKEED